MNALGFKIVDKEEAIFLDIIHEARSKSMPMELGLYKQSNRVQEAFSMLTEGSKNIHFNHNIYNIVDLDMKRELFVSDIRLAKRLGASYGIHHLSRSAFTRRDGFQKHLMQYILKYTDIVETICTKENFFVYIENTYEPLSFYSALFQRLFEQNTKHINFCFDIGHAKIWSDATFMEWMEFLQDLKKMGFHIHFHLHANRGLRDEHLSFIEMEELGFDGNDQHFSILTYAQMLRYITEVFPAERKIFEVKPHYALSNINWVNEALSANAVC